MRSVLSVRMHSPRLRQDQKFKDVPLIIRKSLTNSGKAAHSERALRHFAHALRCSRFDIRCTNDNGDGCTFDERNMELESVVRVIPKLRHRNANGSSVIIHPCNQFVLADDVSPGTIDRMFDDDQRIAAVVETSPGSFQVWIPLAGPLQPVNSILCASACERLVELYDTDPGVAHRDSFGRAPGFFNRKSIYERDGIWPLVVMDNRLSGFRGYDRTLLEEAKRLLKYQPKLLDQRSAGAVPNISSHNTTDIDDYLGPIEILKDGKVIGNYSGVSTDNLFDQWLSNMEQSGYESPERFSRPGVDRSQRDLDILRSMYMSEVPCDLARAALEAGSDKAYKQGTKYVQHLMDAVWGD